MSNKMDVYVVMRSNGTMAGAYRSKEEAQVFLKKILPGLQQGGMSASVQRVSLCSGSDAPDAHGTVGLGTQPDAPGSIGFDFDISTYFGYAPDIIEFEGSLFLRVVAIVEGRQGIVILVPWNKDVLPPVVQATE